jgi:hypothetical protein
MSLKSRFFKKPWQHSNEDKRLVAVREDADPALIEALPELAEQDPSPAVRLAALKRIDEEPAWLEARLRESDADLLDQADRFLLRAATSEGTESGDEALKDKRLRWLERIESGDAIRSLAVSARDRELRRRAQSRINSQGFLGDCYASEGDAELAEGLLERIEQLSTLERLHQKLKKSNKRKAQAVMARLQAVQSSRGQFDAEQVSAERLVEQAEALARGQHLDERDARLVELKATWTELHHVSNSLQARFAGALSIVEAAMARPLPEARQEEPQDHPSSTEPSGPDSPMQTVADAIRAQLRRKSQVVKPQKLLADWDRAWNSLKAVTPADEEIKQAMLPILKELQDQVQRRSRAASAGKDADKTSPGASRSPDTAALASELDTLSELLEAGELARAHALSRELRGRLQSIPARQRPRETSGRLQRLEGRLKELRDYQHWSHNKLRDALIERVEALPGTGQHPDAVAAALKEARGEWQRLEKLELLPGDKRKFAAPGGQWRRFQDACSAAFDTAKPYFEKRQSVQEDNQAQLERFVASGMRLVEDESADPKELMPTMRKARAAIRRLDDLPPKSRGSSAGQLRELMNRISQRLDSAFEQVAEEKRRLIKEARTLGEEPELKVAIDRAKGLQADWKRAGQGQRKTDQALWKEFRAEIDPLFEQLDGQRKAREEADQAAIDQIKQLCSEAEALCTQDEEGLLEASGPMQGLADRLAAIHPKPQALVNRFEKARKRLSDRQSEIRQAREAQAVKRLNEGLKLLQKAFSERLDGRTPDRADADLEALPKALRATLEAILDDARPGDELRAQAEDNLDAARQVAVEFEFLSGLDSPAEEKSRRMNFQVQRLAARMSEGSQKPDLASELGELEARWHGSLPLPPEDFDALARRIEKCQAVIRQMMGIA